MLKKVIAQKPLSVLLVLFIFVILSKMHERDTATEKEFDTELKIILEHVLTKRFILILHFGSSKRSKKIEKV